MKIAFVTLGCKVNQYETHVMEQQFSQEGFALVPSDCEADVYVVNSCTVTATSDQKTRQTVRHYKRLHPNAVIVLTGCYSQAFPEAARLLPEADVIAGTHPRGLVLQLVRRFLETGERQCQVIPFSREEEFEPMSASRHAEKTRAFVKIEDGCERYCAYCIIPTSRGPVRSKPLEDLKKEVQALSRQGYQEVVLVGINLSCYGKELSLGLVDAVECVCQVPGIRRVRLGSLEPELLTDEAIKRMADQEKFCPQFHLSLQSGCSATLKRMNRHYSPEEYSKLVSLLRSRFENPSITTDIMVGFPGETEDEFLQSCAFAQAVGFAKAHVFAYSRREGTAAASRPDQIPNREKERRSREMIRVTEKTRSAFLQQQVGRREEVLLETRKGPFLTGYSKNYTPVYINSSDNLEGEVVTALLTQRWEDGCLGVLTKEQ